MKVAAYQAPLLPAGSRQALYLIRAMVRRCEAEGISILCCPEAVLGGLADWDPNPERFAVAEDRIEAVLSPLASDTVTTILGFTESAGGGSRLYNTAAVYHRGAVAGLYRKRHPAIRRSVYSAGSETPVFRIADLTFGIVLCNDSNYPEPVRRMAARAAAALFVPTNNGLPPSKGGPELVTEARNADVARAVENHMWVIRADVAGHGEGLSCWGSSGIVGPDGKVVAKAAEPFREELLVARIDTPPA